MSRKKRTLTEADLNATSNISQDDYIIDDALSQEGSGIKSRAFFGELYPESVPDWEERLRNAGTRVLAILHDKDVNPDGEPKKPHVHVIQIWDGPIRYERGNAAIMKLGCIKAPIEVRVVQSMATCTRYLLHLDNPEKFLYDRSEVMEFGGADFDEYASRACDREKTIVEMERFVDEHGIVSFRELCAYARDNEPAWHRSLTSTCGWFMKEYIKSAHWTEEQQKIGRI